MEVFVQELLTFLAVEFSLQSIYQVVTKLHDALKNGKEIVIKKHSDLNVVHHSQNFLILNKGYDVLINSNEPGVKTLHHDLCHSYPSLVNPKLQHGFYFTHRLDFATSGAICIALHKKACSAASSAFQNRTSRKYYLALLRGHVAKEIMEISKAIGEDAREVNGSHRMCTTDEISCLYPRTAHTLLLVLQRGLFDGYPATKVLLQPITGRRHQLRVHCSHIGHTIIGDYTYSRGKDVLPYRTFLHAFRLILPNPVEPIDVVTPDPFTTGCLNTWVPVETINELNNHVFDKLCVNGQNNY
ncbi:RNA pseudouridylate synthase domain-containing protein 1-like [Macrosteles quadrilineatus]|uniref:RNA pseudouridylate synthase domain-containing protein 1-like n=1 Tax=Macrosteles quadrilineatus TaxID=74068 RepID=UPI0023E1DA19|nr:RNA pseudouridylate synthase domain-containing protein 1-like [Macrosteles quadrilineatus]